MKVSMYDDLVAPLKKTAWNPWF